MKTDYFPMCFQGSVTTRTVNIYISIQSHLRSRSVHGTIEVFVNMVSV